MQLILKQVADDLKESSKTFVDVIQPLLEPLMKGEFEVVEGVTVEKMAKQLDVLAGIDLWHIDKQKGMRGIASRVQVSDRSWDTYTIRKERASGARTEYEKRKSAIDNNYLYPYLTLQAYVTKRKEFLSVSIARTEDIINMIDKGFCRLQHTRSDKVGQASFYVVSWHEMKKKGYKIYINKRPQEVC